MREEIQKIPFKFAPWFNMEAKIPPPSFWAASIPTPIETDVNDGNGDETNMQAESSESDSEPGAEPMDVDAAAAAKSRKRGPPAEQTRKPAEAAGEEKANENQPITLQGAGCTSP